MKSVLLTNSSMMYRMKWPSSSPGLASIYLIPVLMRAATIKSISSAVVRLGDGAFFGGIAKTEYFLADGGKVGQKTETPKSNRLIPNDPRHLTHRSDLRYPTPDVRHSHIGESSDIFREVCRRSRQHSRLCVPYLCNSSQMPYSVRYAVSLLQKDIVSQESIIRSCFCCPNDIM